MSKIQRRTIGSVVCWSALIMVCSACDALAHEGEPLEPHDLWTAWEWDPVIILCLLITAVLYWHGVRKLREHAGEERGVKRWNRFCFWAGWGSLVLALISPLHPMGEVLFSAHMVQHEILMLVSAPLLVLGKPIVPFLWALPRTARSWVGEAVQNRYWRRFWRKLTAPLTAWIIHSIALWAWHAPALFQATVSNDFVHALQHISFLGSALLFSWALLHSSHGRKRYGVGVLYVFSIAIHTSILGALLTFSRSLWYPVYSTTTAAWGLTPIQDQQIGGLIMWVPAGIVYLVAGLAFFAAWLRTEKGGALAPVRPLGSISYEES